MATWEKSYAGIWALQAAVNRTFNGFPVQVWIQILDSGLFEVRHPLFFGVRRQFSDFESAKACGENWLAEAETSIGKLIEDAKAELNKLSKGKPNA